MFCRKITFYVRIAYYILYFSCSLSFADTHRVYIHGDIHDNVVSATLMTLTVPQFHQRGLNPGRNITTLPHHRRSPSRISPLAAPIHPLHGHGDSQHSNRPPLVTFLLWQYILGKQISSTTARLNAEIKERSGQVQNTSGLRRTEPSELTAKT